MLQVMSNLDSPEELQREMASVPRLVVHFTASWNGRYDSEMQHRLEPLRTHYHPRIRFATADADAEGFWPLLREWRVLNLPALVCFAFGYHIRTVVGLRSEHQLIELFDALAATAEHDSVAPTAGCNSSRVT